MLNDKDINSREVFEQALAASRRQHRYVLQLFIAGMTARSCDALNTIRGLCEQHLKGHYDLEVIDIYQDQQRAAAEQIIAVPTLVRRSPEPMRRLIGELSDLPRVREILGITSKEC